MRSLFLGVVCLGLGLVPGVQAEPELSATARRGRELFGVHCASCHGRDAFGHGPLAVDLRARVPDLTRIAERRDGTFDPEEVRKSIDGTLEVPGHGTQAMPVWGEGFGRGPRATEPEEIERAIDALVIYLEEIQADPRAEDP